MSVRVRWLKPEEQDSDVHIMSPGGNGEHTLCGAAFDGDSSANNYLVSTNKKATCSGCIEIVKFCKAIRASEMED